MDTSKITNVLIFKDGYYWLTEQDSLGGYYETDIVDRNGFEFASDAYAYLTYLSSKRDFEEVIARKEHREKCKYHFIDIKTLWAWITLPPTIASEVSQCPHCGFRMEEPEYNNKEEERLKEMGEV